MKHPNLTDAVLLLCGILFFSLCTAFSRILVAPPTGDTPLTYTVALDPVLPESAEALAVGDAVLDAIGKYPLGSVTACTGSERGGWTYLTLTVRVTGKSTADGFFAGGFLLRPGRDVDIRLPGFRGTGRITAVFSDTVTAEAPA